MILINRHSSRQIFANLILAIAVIFSGFAFADRNKIDKVYHPYVQVLEKEFEYRIIAQEDNKSSLDKVLKHRFGFAYSPIERFKFELYMIAEDNNDESFKISAYELETKIQLTEQGEYWADWGLLFEFEKEHAESIWGYTGSLLIEKEWGQWIGAANLKLGYEWGSDINNDLEGTVALQGRYRYSQYLEPAVEFYAGEDTLGIGPVLVGQLRLGTMKKLKWEAGVIFGLDGDTPNQTLRGLLEFEF